MRILHEDEVNVWTALAFHATLAAMEPVLLYITAKDKTEAEMLARALLEARLAACVNIFPATTSLYHWEGEIRASDECVLIAKSLRQHAAAASELVKSLHSYECPCIISLPVTGGDAPFLEWVAAEVKA